MSRVAFLAGLRSCAPELLPFERLLYDRQSSYCWWDAKGRCRVMAQGEGCEHGFPLAPALFALGQHSTLCSAASALHPAETLVDPGRERECRDTVVGAVERDCGIASNIAQTCSRASDWFPPRERRRLLNGRGGLTLCQCSASASRPSLSPARTRAQKGGANRRARSPLQQRERSSKMRARVRAPSGRPSLKAPALPACGTQAWVIGRTAGSPTRREFATYTSASACFCRLCRQVPAHLCPRRPGRMQGPG